MYKCKISVILPVYNSANYLRRCVDSILAQSFEDFELILVNDGSTDKSGEICEEYALKDSRVCVFHKENGGVSSARNLGLDYVNGEVCVFVDSDDYIDKTYLEVLYSNGLYDLVVCGYMAEGRENYFYRPYPNEEYTCIKDLLNKNRRFSNPICRGYKSSIIKKNNIRFDENLHLYEDLIFNLDYCQYVSSAKTYSDCLYHYISTPNSLSSRTYSWSYLESIVNHIDNKISSLEKRHNWDGSEMLSSYVWDLIRRYMTFLQVNKPITTIARELCVIRSNLVVLKMLNNSSEYKSIFRKFFDFLMCGELYLLAALVLKIEI